MSSTEQAVAPGKVVTIRYKLSRSGGEVVETSGRDAPFRYTHGKSEIVPGLEKALEGKRPGDRMTVTVAPEAGFGRYRPEDVHTLSRDLFPASAHVVPGMVCQGTDQLNNSIIGTVKSVDGDSVTVDFNHPLAGEELRFDVEVDEVRDPTDEERQRGPGDAPWSE
jgi:FKBP-type peptidyl-prolyl cis-trans isomerase SlyD